MDFKSCHLTCGFVNGFDTRDTLSCAGLASEREAQRIASGRVLFIALLGSFIISFAFADSSFAYKNHTMNLKLYAHNEIKDWDQFICYIDLIHAESRWNYKAKNGSHYGLGQMRSEWYRDLTPRQQIKAHLRYIDHRYKGKPCLALGHFVKWGWH